MRSPSRSASSRGTSPLRHASCWSHPGYSEVTVASSEQVTTPRLIREASRQAGPRACPEDLASPAARPHQPAQSSQSSEPPRERPRSATSLRASVLVAPVAADTGGGAWTLPNSVEEVEASKSSPSSGAGTKNKKSKPGRANQRIRSTSAGRGSGGADGLAARPALRYPLRRSESLPMLQEAPAAVSASATASVPVAAVAAKDSSAAAVAGGSGSGSPQSAGGRRRKRH